MVRLIIFGQENKFYLEVSNNLISSFGEDNILLNSENKIFVLNSVFMSLSLLVSFGLVIWIIVEIINPSVFGILLSFNVKISLPKLEAYRYLNSNFDHFIACKIDSQLLSLPMHEMLLVDEIDFVCNKLRTILDKKNNF